MFVEVPQLILIAKSTIPDVPKRRQYVYPEEGRSILNLYEALKCVGWNTWLFLCPSDRQESGSRFLCCDYLNGDGWL